MSKTIQIDRIIQESLPQITSGQTTVDAVLSAYPELAHLLRPQLEALLWLGRAKQELEPRPGYISASKHRLLAEITQKQAESPWQRLLRVVPNQKFAFQLVSVFLLFISLFAATHSLVLASRLALPGSALYTFKLNVEQLQLAFTADKAADARLQIEFSQRRTSEIVELVLEGDYSYIPGAATLLESNISNTLSTLAQVEKQDPALAAALSDQYATTLSNETFILRIMAETSPLTAQPGIQMALDVANAGLAMIGQ